MKTLKPHIRWCIRRDMPEILAWELDTPGGWDLTRYLHMMRQRNVITMVAEMGEKVVGAVVYELLADRIKIRRVTVDPRHRRQGIGQALVEKILAKCRYTPPPTSRKVVTATVPETRLHAQLFFKSMGFTGRLSASKIRFRHVFRGHDDSVLL